MTDHLPGTPEMITPTTFLCAFCGALVRMEWAAPCFGLCEACEERVQQQPVSYTPVVASDE
jgi:hypothetical protein